MDGGVGDTLRQPGEDPDSDQQGGVHLGQQWSQHRQHRRGRDPEQEDSLTAVLGGKVAAGNLSENVTVKETSKN